MDQHSFDIAQRFFTAKFPDAECAFVAGSLMRGEGKPHSDIDLVVLYGPDFMAVRREAHAFEGVMMDVFLHNEQAQDFFFDKDVRRSVCALLSMIVEGSVIGKDAALAEKRKRMAQALIEKGPPPLDESDLKRRRYFISDLLDDLRDNRPPGEVGTGTTIWPRMIGRILATPQFQSFLEHLGLSREVRSTSRNLSPLRITPDDPRMKH